MVITYHSLNIHTASPMKSMSSLFFSCALFTQLVIDLHIRFSFECVSAHSFTREMSQLVLANTHANNAFTVLFLKIFSVTSIHSCTIHKRALTHYSFRNS